MSTIDPKGSRNECKARVPIRIRRARDLLQHLSKEASAGFGRSMDKDCQKLQEVSKFKNWSEASLRFSSIDFSLSRGT